MDVEHPLYLAGLNLYRCGRYWDSHEAWETLWRQSAGPEKHLLQALIQLDAALLQAERGRWGGAVTLLGRCLANIEQAGDPWPQLTEQVRACLDGVRRVHDGVSPDLDPALKPVL